VTPNNAHQLLFRLKGKLGGAIRAWVLWRGAGPGCGELDRAISDAGLTTFGPEAVRVIGRHAQRCAGCSERQELRLAPEALFAAMPIVAAPPLVKAEAAAALGRAGVPMAGSRTGVSGDGEAGGAAGGDDAAGPAGGETAQLAAPEGVSGEPPPGAPGKRRPRGLVTAAVAGVGLLVAVIVLVVVASGSGDNGDGVETVLSGPSTTDAPSTPTTSPATEPAGPPKPAPEDAPTAASAAPATTATSLSDTTSSTSSTSTSAVPAVPPTIDRFAATPPVTSACSSAAGAGEVTVSWASDGASATLSGPGGTTTVPPSGSAVRCARSGDTFTLVVANQEGATATAAATVPGP
jgi:hypothetical protein